MPFEYGKKYSENPDGYIVCESGGWCGLNYGCAERWFSGYDEAIEYAIKLVREFADSFKKCLDVNEVIVYEGPEELTHKTHGVPCGRVVFSWRNK